MDSQFDVIYREQLELYRSSQLALTRILRALAAPFERASQRRNAAASLGIVNEAIERGVSRALGGNKSLRSDARLFLFVSLHQMVALPLMDDRANRRFGETDLRNKLADDVETILAAAADKEEGRKDIAASHIVKGTADVIDKLNLKDWRLWERDSDGRS